MKQPRKENEKDSQRVRITKQKETHNEDPSPAGESRSTIQLQKAICQDASKCRCHAADKVKDSISLLEIVSRIPCAEQIHAAGIEASLEEAKEDPK